MMLGTITMAILATAGGPPQPGPVDNARTDQLSTLTANDVTHALTRAKAEIDRAEAFHTQARPIEPRTALPLISEVMAQPPRPGVAGQGAKPYAPQPAPDNARHARLYAKLMDPLAAREPPTTPLRAHGYYWFTGQASLTQIGNCIHAYQQLKKSYPTPAVMLNRALLRDSQTCSMLMSVLTGDILAWVDVGEEPDDLKLLAAFLTRYGSRVTMVVLGDAPAVARRDRQPGPPRRLVRSETYGLWLGFVRYALPGRPALLVLPAGDNSGAAGSGVLSAVKRRGADGICLWNHPDLRQGQLNEPEKFTADLDRRIGRSALYLAGDWAAAERDAFQTARVQQSEKAIEKSFAGYVRCVGLIPDRCRAIHTAYSVSTGESLTLRTRP